MAGRNLQTCADYVVPRLVESDQARVACVVRHPVVVEHLVIERDEFRRLVRQRVVGCARQPARLRRYAFWSRAPEEARQAPLQEGNPAPVVLQRAADVIVAAERRAAHQMQSQHGSLSDSPTMTRRFIPSSMIWTVICSGPSSPDATASRPIFGAASGRSGFEPPRTAE